MIRLRRVEWPTLILAIACTLAWMSTVYLVGLGEWWLMPIAVLLITLHSSLQHEALHGHPSSDRILNEALATEIVCVLRYMHHYFMATGVHGTAARDEFKEHADEEREHADLVAERIQQLGGKPDFNPKSLLERSVSHYVEGETLAGMIREDLIAERMVIELYQQMIRHFANDDPTTRTMLEKLLHDEEEHASDLTDLLYIVNPETGKTQGQDPGTEPLRIPESAKKPAA